MERKIAQSQEGRQAEKALQTEENRGSAFAGVGDGALSERTGLTGLREPVPGDIQPQVYKGDASIWTGSTGKEPESIQAGEDEKKYVETHPVFSPYFAQFPSAKSSVDTLPFCYERPDGRTVPLIERVPNTYVVQNPQVAQDMAGEAAAYTALHKDTNLIVEVGPGTPRVFTSPMTLAEVRGGKNVILAIDAKPGIFADSAQGVPMKSLGGYAPYPDNIVMYLPLSVLDFQDAVHAQGLPEGVTDEVVLNGPFPSTDANIRRYESYLFEALNTLKVGGIGRIVPWEKKGLPEVARLEDQLKSDKRFRVTPYDIEKFSDFYRFGFPVLRPSDTGAVKTVRDGKVVRAFEVTRVK